MRVSISQITRDKDIFARASFHQKTVAEYAESMLSGYSLPPVIVFFDGSAYLLADGFHRVEAAILAGFKEVEVDLKTGSHRDAVLYAVGANTAHGLRRTNADKKLAITRLLQDSEWGQWSDRYIGKLTGTSHKSVGKLREEITGEKPSERLYQNRWGQTAVMNVAYIKGSSSLVTPAKFENFLVRERWLGLDPGLSKLRWAVLEAVDIDLPRLVDYGVIETTAKSPISQRLYELEQDLLIIFEEFKPTVVGVEMPYLENAYPNITGVLEAIGVIELVCYREKNLTPIRYYPRQWKMNLCDSRADNDEVNDTLAMMFDLEISTSVKLDAIGIALAAFCGVNL
jgi:Holliday junction resolvasome RuvABC endonuclease subunit